MHAGKTTTANRGWNKTSKHMTGKPGNARRQTRHALCRDRQGRDKKRKGEGWAHSVVNCRCRRRNEVRTGRSGSGITLIKQPLSFCHRREMRVLLWHIVSEPPQLLRRARECLESGWTPTGLSLLPSSPLALLSRSLSPLAVALARVRCALSLARSLARLHCRAPVRRTAAG